MLSVILLESETPGNVGSIARVMKNFSMTNLVLINPKCNHLANEAKSRATKARSILKNAKIISWKDIKKYDYVIGTTSMLGTDYNIPRSPITPEELAVKLSDKKGNIALLFGREGSGLKNKEILECDFIITIPASKKYPVMNISHAVAIVLYEIFRKSKKVKVADHISPISYKEKEIIMNKIDGILNRMPFQTKSKRETQRKLWVRIIGKAMLTKREAFSLLGFLDKIKK